MSPENCTHAFEAGLGLGLRMSAEGIPAFILGLLIGLLAMHIYCRLVRPRGRHEI